MTNKDKSIEYILDHGLMKPKTVGEQVADIFRSLGWRFVFWDTAYSLIFATLTVAVVFAVFAASPGHYRFSATVAAAPLLYLMISVFTETTERVSRIYELKQTCYYTTRQITALRTACYSIAGAVYTAVLALISMNSSAEFLPMLALGLLALFVCAVPQLLITRLTRCKWANAIYATLWVFVNLALPMRLGEDWEKLLENLPIAVSLSIAAVGALILAYQIYKMLKEVEPYAIA